MMHFFDKFKDISIFSSRIYKYIIYEDSDTVFIDVFFELIYPRNKYIKVTFKDVKEYSIYWNCNYYHSYVEDVKYVQKENLHYISFDPNQEVNTISEKDQNFILCSNIEIDYLSNK